MAVRESAADYTGHRTADARRRRALALVLFALDVIEELRRLLLVVVIEDVRDGEGGDRGELLAGFGVSPQVDVHLGQGRYSKADRKSTRLNSSHSQISYAVFCLKKKNNEHSIY